jgi:hypothetical protein
MLQFGLLDLLVANRELRLDDTSELMEQFSLQAHHRALMEQYRQELKHTTTQKALQDILVPERFEESTLVQGLLSVMLKFAQVQEWPVLLIRLMNLGHPSREADFKRISGKIAQYSWLDMISKQFRKWLGHSLNRFAREELVDLAQRLKYNALAPPEETAGMEKKPNSDPYRTLRVNNYRQQQQIRQWVELLRTQPKIQNEWQFLLTETSREIRERILVEHYGLSANYPYYSQALKWAILSSLETEAINQPAKVLTVLETLRSEIETDPLLQQVLELLLWTARFFEERNRIRTFTLDQPEEYLRTYVTEWYKIDQAYRRAITVTKAIDESELPDTFTLQSVCDALNQHYLPFLEASNRQWLKCLKEFGFDYSRLKAPKSYDFFQREIGNTAQKVAVLISDALACRTCSQVKLLGFQSVMIPYC